jgi:hypothetical protein
LREKKTTGAEPLQEGTHPLKIRRISRSSPRSSTVSAARKPDSRRPSGLPWAWRSFSRLAGGALAIISGLLLFGPAPAWLSGSYFTEEATYISQTTQNPFLGPHLRVEVRFTTNSNANVIGYVYPQYGKLPNKAKLIPIIFSGSIPRKVYYDGPGGDYNNPATPVPFYPLVGTVLIIAGLYLMVSVVIWRLRMSLLFSRGPRSQLVDVRWQHKKTRHPTVTITDRENGSEYAWEVVRAETPVDGLVKRVHAFTRRTDEASAERTAGPRPAVAELLGEPGPHKWLILHSANDVVFPASMAEPVVGTDPLPPLPASYRTILVAHRRLVAAYAAALERADALPIFVRPSVPYDGIPVWHYLRTLLCLRSLVRLHVESHIRRQLRHLTQAYVRSQLLIPEVTKAANEQRRGLAELQGECQLLSGSLMDIRRRLSSSLVGLVAAVPALAVIVQIHQVRASLLIEDAVFWIFGALLVMPGLFALIAYTDAFRCKRALFASSPAIGKRLRGTRESIYKLEIELFTQLGQRKLPERASDYWAYAVILVAWAACETSYLRSQGPYRSVSVGDWVLFSILTLLLLFVLVKKFKRRLSEDR